MLNRVEERFYKRQKKKILDKCTHEGNCRCRRKVKWILNKIEANIPLKYIRYGFKNMTHPDIQKAKKAIQFYVKNLDVYFDEGEGYYLHGSPGLGKTAFGTIILSYALSKGFTIYYEEFADLVEFYTKAWDKQGDAKEEIRHAFVDKVYESDFLMIDGLGLEIKSSIGTSIMERVVRTRVNYNLPTIYASRLSLDTLCENHFKSKALLSLITESINNEITLVGKDARKKGKNK